MSRNPYAYPPRTPSIRSGRSAWAQARWRFPQETGPGTRPTACVGESGARGTRRLPYFGSSTGVARSPRRHGSERSWLRSRDANRHLAGNSERGRVRKLAGGSTGMEPRPASCLCTFTYRAPSNERMITLYTFGPAFGLPDPSPFVTKVEVLLKMAGLAYGTDTTG